MKIIDNLKRIFQHKIKIPNWFFVTSIILSAIGLINASYLLGEHYAFQDAGNSTICVIEIMGNCNDVLHSQYSEFMGIPMAALGVLYYLGVIITLLILKYRPLRGVAFSLFGLTIFGLIFSVVLVYLQFFVIYAVCPYCMLSAFLSLALFLLDLFFMLSIKNLLIRCFRPLKKIFKCKF